MARLGREPERNILEYLSTGSAGQTEPAAGIGGRRCLRYQACGDYSDLDDLYDRREKTESHAVSVLKLVARTRCDSRAVDESTVGAARVFDLHATRARRCEDDRVSR